MNMSSNILYHSECLDSNKSTFSQIQSQLLQYKRLLINVLPPNLYPHIKCDIHSPSANPSDCITLDHFYKLIQLHLVYLFQSIY